MFRFSPHFFIPVVLTVVAYSCTPTDDSDDGGEGGSSGSSGTSSGGSAGTTGGSGAGRGGTSGSAGDGSAGEAGMAGAGAESAGGSGAGTAGASQGGAGGAGEGGAGEGGTGGLCGALGEACCQNSCDTELVCLGETRCSCVEELFGRYIVRADRKALFVSGSNGATQTAIVDATTGFPLEGIKDVQDGRSHGCATVEGTGRAVCWRTASNGNAQGQLGNGALESTGPLYRASEVLTNAGQPLTNVVSVSSGASPGSTDSACAVREDGTVYCWGNLRDITNNGSTLQSPYAVPITTDGVTPLTDALQIVVSSLGSRHYACALLQGSAGKEVWCWGANSSGNLGLGDETNRQYPTRVVGFTDPNRIVTADRTACVLDGDEVRCFGHNNAGEAGVGSSSSHILAPTLVTVAGGAALDGVRAIAPGDGNGGHNFCTLRNDTTSPWCWGAHYGGTASAYNVPNVVALGAAGFFAGQFAGPYVLTSDGVYHVGSTLRTPNCGAL